MRDPVRVAAADTLLVESTYGDRPSSARDAAPIVEQAVRRAAEQRGWLLITGLRHRAHPGSAPS
jgi:metallo-beta-lactamase family protein